MARLLRIPARPFRHVRRDLNILLVVAAVAIAGAVATTLAIMAELGGLK